MMKTAKLQAYSVESFDRLRTLRRRTLSEVEVRIAYSQKLSAIRYPLSANKKCYPLNAKILRLLICSFAFFILHFNCYAQPVSSTELINNAKVYDRKTVAYEGEVIGDVMARGEYAWVNLNDGANAIGIWMRKDLTREIAHTASYKSRGDWLEVTGIFSRACPAHGGDLDIHAAYVRKITAGRPLEEHLNPGKKNFAFILLGALCLILTLNALKPK